MSGQAVGTQTDSSESFSEQKGCRKVHGYVHTNLGLQKEEQQAVMVSRIS